MCCCCRLASSETQRDNMDDDYATDADLALSRKRGVERLIDGTKLQDVVVSSIDGRGMTFIFSSNVQMSLLDSIILSLLLFSLSTYDFLNKASYKSEEFRSASWSSGRSTILECAFGGSVE